jgi:hypothetical protein
MYGRPFLRFFLFSSFRRVLSTYFLLSLLMFSMVEAALTHFKYDTAISRAYHRLLSVGVGRLLWLLLRVGLPSAVILF